MGYYYADEGRWPVYVPVAERRRKAQKELAGLLKKGKSASPVIIEGRNIATTFWGRAWCDNLESYSDYANRLPRGRTYVRNGSVVDLQLEAGKVSARVMGSQLYHVQVAIEPIAKVPWQALIKECSGKVDSLVELLQGKLSQSVMEVITRPGKGLFPSPRHVKFSCSCPDSAGMCKHVAAALYGVGARLDHEPELLFRLRQVDKLELITKASGGHSLGKVPASAKGKALAGADLSALFGIDLDPGDAPPAPAKPQPKARALMTRKELLASGLSASTLQSWLRTGLLLPSGDRGIYKTTAPARKQLGQMMRMGQG